MWSFLGPNETSTLKAGGFYTTLVRPGLRLVAVNTQYGDLINFWLYAGKGTGGPDQFAWLQKTLSAARQNNEKVIFMSHMPCNHAAGILDDYCGPLVKILDSYDDIVFLILSGHTHDASHVILTPQLVQYVTPSVTTFSSRNPSVRVFVVDAASWEVERVDTYIVDISKTSVRSYSSCSFVVSTQRFFVGDFCLFFRWHFDNSISVSFLFSFFLFECEFSHIWRLFCLSLVVLLFLVDIFIIFLVFIFIFSFRWNSLI